MTNCSNSMLNVTLVYDPQVFPEPDSYKPERWTKASKTSSTADQATSSSITKDTEANEISSSASVSTFEGFLGFSFGPRTCIGHKFAKVEAVAFLTLLLREWRVELALKPGETKEGWEKRVIRPKCAISLAVKDVPLKLVRRK